MSVNIPVQIQMQVRPFIIGSIIELLNYFQAQLKKLKKKTWRNVTFSKVAGFSLQPY